MRARRNHAAVCRPAGRATAMTSQANCRKSTIPMISKARQAPAAQTCNCRDTSSNPVLLGRQTPTGKRGYAATVETCAREHLSVGSSLCNPSSVLRRLGGSALCRSAASERPWHLWQETAVEGLRPGAREGDGTGLSRRPDGGQGRALGAAMRQPRVVIQAYGASKSTTSAAVRGRRDCRFRQHASPVASIAARICDDIFCCVACQLQPRLRRGSLAWPAS